MWSGCSNLMHAWHIHGLKRTTCLAILQSEKNVHNLSSEVLKATINSSQYNPVFDIPRWSSLVLLGVTIQSDCKFRARVNLKLIEANKWLDVLRTLTKEQYSQADIDHLFTSLVLPNFIYGVPVYGASEPDLNVIQNFLDVIRAVSFLNPFKRPSIKDGQDCKIFKKVASINNHPSAPYIPSKNVGSYNLRKKQCTSPKIKTVRFISAVVCNRLIS